MTWHFSRVRLRKDASSTALASILLPEDIDHRVTVAHKLLWGLFADGPDRRRDFLWREADQGFFYILSARPPLDQHSLFAIESKEFAPALKQGDILDFSLRANATTSRSAGKGVRGKRSDVVMHAIKPYLPEQRAGARAAETQKAGAAWLDRQSARHGFSVKTLDVEAYRVLRPPHARLPMRIATLDFSGTLAVTDSDIFVRMLTTGLGRAKAYGCGLMLIRRLHG